MASVAHQTVTITGIPPFMDSIASAATNRTVLPTTADEPLRVGFGG